MASINHYALLIEYDGSGFYGFQKQLNTRTIQGELEVALTQFANSPVEVITSGRTDTGVHATHQVVSFSTVAARDSYGWIRGVNALLPRDIAVLNIVQVSPEFNARFSARSRTYHYYLLVDQIRPVILRGKVGWYHAPLDIDNMRSACMALVGRMDFSSFRASDCQAQSPLREISRVTLAQRGKLLRFEFTANAFLYHMVRNMVGALVYVGNGKLSVEQFINLIKTGNRTKAPPTFMADGLYLVNVMYPEKIFVKDDSMWLFGGDEIYAHS